MRPTQASWRPIPAHHGLLVGRHKQAQAPALAVQCSGWYDLDAVFLGGAGTAHRMTATSRAWLVPPRALGVRTVSVTSLPGGPYAGAHAWVWVRMEKGQMPRGHIHGLWSGAGRAGVGIAHIRPHVWAGNSPRHQSSLDGLR